MEVRAKRLDPRALLPLYASAGAGGGDLHALDGGALEPGEHRAVGTGLALEVPLGYGALITPRSGLSAKYSVGVLNSPGLVDSDYRGEVKVLLVNRGKQRFAWEAGERIAQLVLVALPQARFVEVEELGGTQRGEGGFGSTGR
jgi:dUTP pyrophosphatase